MSNKNEDMDDNTLYVRQLRNSLIFLAFLISIGTVCNVNDTIVNAKLQESVSKLPIVQTCVNHNVLQKVVVQ